MGNIPLGQHVEEGQLEAKSTTMTGTLMSTSTSFGDANETCDDDGGKLEGFDDNFEYDGDSDKILCSTLNPETDTSLSCPSPTPSRFISTRAGYAPFRLR